MNPIQATFSPATLLLEALVLSAKVQLDESYPRSVRNNARNRVKKAIRYWRKAQVSTKGI